MIISELQYLESISNESSLIEGGHRRRRRRRPRVGNAVADGTLDGFADGVNRARTTGIVELTAEASRGDAFAATYIDGRASAS